MRLKSYVAPSMAEAMQLVRQELGENAIIVSTQRAANGKGIRITAALEPTDADEAVGSILAEIGNSPAIQAVRDAFESHGVPQRVAERLVNAVRVHGGETPKAACIDAFAAAFIFHPTPLSGAPRPFIMVGPNGSGKSVSLVKIAAASVMKGNQVRIISCDTLRAGANAQLAAFARILNVELVIARDARTLAHEAEIAHNEADLTLIDSPGLNPFKKEDMDYLSGLIEMADPEPVLVMQAGGDVSEAAEIGEIFAGVGATGLIATKLDATRKLGALIAAADAGQLAFAGLGATPSVADGLTPLTPDFLAQLILPDAVTDDTVVSLENAP